jgi:hypothetical protein
MRKEQLAHYISNEVQFVSQHEREDLKKDLLKMREKSLRFLAEHIEYIQDKIKVEV